VRLDADKEGLCARESRDPRPATARNVDGKVILYADKINGSMERAMEGDLAPPAPLSRPVSTSHGNQHRKSVKAHISRHSSNRLRSAKPCPRLDSPAPRGKAGERRGPALDRSAQISKAQNLEALE